MFRHMHGIRIGRLNKGVTDATIFEGIDIGLSTQDFERLIGVEPRGRTLAGLTVVQRAELELRREEWAEKLRERKPPGADDSDSEDEGPPAGGSEEEKAKKAAAAVRMTPEEKVAAEKANALLIRTAPEPAVRPRCVPGVCVNKRTLFYNNIGILALYFLHYCKGNP